LDGTAASGKQATPPEMKGKMEPVADVHLPPRVAAPETAVSITKRSELILSNLQLPGLVSRVTGLLAGHDIQVLAASPYFEGQSRQWLVVVSDGLGATTILHQAGIHFTTESVLLLVAPLRPAVVTYLGTTLTRHGIGIEYTTPRHSTKAPSPWYSRPPTTTAPFPCWPTPVQKSGVSTHEIATTQTRCPPPDQCRNRQPGP
jgi:hypothetical protein